ncbi:hypothetical protein FRB90_011812 [Tulasnella sp. 427]|nr:hypothetical protein FRB90_011812 [Tulasnella sp. 427]
MDTAERSYHKQPIFQRSKPKTGADGTKITTFKTKRWYKNVGLGYKTPPLAIQGDYIDHKCPFTSNVTIRGRILTGRVISTKMTRTIIVRRDYMHYIPKYHRYEKRHKNLAAHCSPAFRVEVGDIVTVGQCRPLSKTSSPQSTAPADTPVIFPMAPKSFLSSLFSSRKENSSSQNADSKKIKKEKGPAGGDDGEHADGLNPDGSKASPSSPQTGSNGKSKGSRLFRREPSPHPPGSNGAGLPASDSTTLNAPSEPSSSTATLPTQPPPIDIPSTQTILSNPNPGSISTPGTGATIGPGSATTQRALDVDDMINRLLDVGYTGKVSKSLCLKQSEITLLCLAAREVFLSQPTLIELSPPVKIVGDVHGQYSDLIRLFEMCGFPPQSNYLFLGDYVDRGKQSLETILLLLCYKVKYPENFFLLRGNHECANVTRAADWEDNERGVSYCFGKAVINEFLGKYDMDLICRAHMVVEDGYEFWNDRTLVTVFSAPNYCGEFDNYGACMSVSEDLLCAFELLKPLDGPALRKEMVKAKRKSLAPTSPIAGSSFLEKSVVKPRFGDREIGMWRRLFQQHSVARLLSPLFQPLLRLSALSICAQEQQHAMSADPCQISALYAFHNTPRRISHDYDPSLANGLGPDSISNPRPTRRSTASPNGAAQSKSPLSGSRFWKRRSSAVLLDSATDGETAALTTAENAADGATQAETNADRDESPSSSALLATPRAQSTLQRPASSYLDIDKDLPQLPERPLPPIVASGSVADLEPGSSASAGPGSASQRTHARPARVTSPSNTQPRRASIAFVDSDSPRQPKDTSITFALPPDSVATTLSAKPLVSVRRSHSFFADGKACSDTEEAEARVKRRLSVGAALFGDGKGKGKEKEADEPQTDHEEKNLTRKSSFWSRRRRKDSTPNSPRPPAPVTAEPPLPTQTPTMERNRSSASSHNRRRSNSHSVLDRPGPSSTAAPSLPPLSFSPEAPGFLSPESGAEPASNIDFTLKTFAPKKFSGGLFSRPSSSRERTAPDGGRPSSASTSTVASPRQSLDSPHATRKSYTASRSSSILRRSDDALGSRSKELNLSSQDLSSAPPSAIGWNSHEHGVIREGQPSRFISKTVHERRSETLPAEGRRRTMSLRHPDGSLTHLSIPAPPLPTGANADAALLTPSTSDLSTPFSPSGYVTVTRTPSLASVSDASHSSSRQSHPQPRMTRTGRARASTSAGPLAAASPTLLRRLSQHFFPSSNSSVTSASNFSSNNASSTMLSLPNSNGKPSLSRRNSTTEGSATASASTFGNPAPVTLASSAVSVPKPRIEAETPERYLARLVQAVSKAEIATVLASR